jgi:hypothetical protein
LWPVSFIATDRETPARSGFRTALALAIEDASDDGIGECGASPANDGEHDLLQQGTQALLFVAIGRGGRGPDAPEILADGAETVGVDPAENAPLLMLAGLEFVLGELEIPQALLPLNFEPPSHEALFRFDRAIPAPGLFGHERGRSPGP